MTPRECEDVSKRNVTVDDIKQFQWPGNPVFSPNGQWVVFEQRTVKDGTDEYHTQLIMTKADGSDRRVLTHAGTYNGAPCWSPDGSKLAFLSNREAGTQVWVLPMDGGEAQRLTRFRQGIRSVLWGPDGTVLYGIVPVEEGESVELFDIGKSVKEISEAMTKAGEEWKDNPKRYNWLYYKHDGGGLSKHLVAQLVSMQLISGEVKQLTSGQYDVSEPTVSPDGKFVAFISNRRPDYEVNPRSHIYRIASAGGNVDLLCDDANADSLSYSPDGRRIAFFGNRDEYRFATHTHLFVVSAEGGASTDFSDGFPDTLGNFCISDMRSHEHTPGPIWSPSGEQLYALSTREGKCEIVRFAQIEGVSSWQVVVGGEREIYGLSYDGDKRFAIAYTTVEHPGKVAVVELGADVGVRTERMLREAMETRSIACYPDNEVRLDTCNDQILAEIEVSVPESFWYQSEDQWMVQGFIVKPNGFEQGKKYPVILEIHGGPHAMFSYSYFHEIQWLAAQGYAVVYVNPRGSMGYGQEFVNACRHHYGENDAADILNGLDVALEQYSFLDPHRVAVTGGSYGGFMTNWLVGHTDRFFAAVSQRSISNWISFYGVSDVGAIFTETEMGGNIFDDQQALWEKSPLAYAQNVKTPLLLIHSEEDLRCPIEQAEQFYTAIKRREGETELLRVPHASHDLSRTGKPNLRIDRLQAIFAFINSRLPLLKA
jgi:dipeptidyl aminopeptidase/acylaminoacyl peptidase